MAFNVPQVTGDPWWDARLYSASLETLQDAQKLRTRFTGLFDASALPSDQTIIIDLNKYRPNADLQGYYNAGVKHVILRMGGPAYFQAGNWQLTEDPTYRKYYDQARALKMTIGGYVVYSAGIDAADYENSEILLDFAEQIMSGSRYKPDYFIVDDEVNGWYENGKKVYATAVNQVAGLKYLFPKVFRRWRLMPVHYTAQWFMRQTSAYQLEYTTWLDNYNNTGTGYKNVLSWFAWYLDAFNNGTKVYEEMQDALADIPTYTSTSVSNYLNIGNNLYDLHQFTSNWKTPWNKDANGNIQGVDASVTRKSAQLFFADLNINISPNDAVPPSVPSGLTATNITNMSITLSWLPSTDNVGVSGYSVLNGPDQIASVPGTQTSYTLTAQPNTTYNLSIDAFDAAGNHSQATPSLSVTTLPTTGQGCRSSLLGLFK